MVGNDGLYGPPYNSNNITGKHWPPTKTNRSIHSFDLHLKERWIENRFVLWLTECKYYGAEYLEEDEGIESLAGILASYLPKDKYIDPVETVRQIRDPPDIED